MRGLARLGVKGRRPSSHMAWGVFLWLRRRPEM
jgi:hypothetical protein